MNIYETKGLPGPSRGRHDWARFFRLPLATLCCQCLGCTAHRLWRAKRERDCVTQRQGIFFKCQKTCDTLNSDALCVGCNLVVYSTVFAEKQLRTRAVECDEIKISLDDLQSCCKPASIQTSIHFCHKKRHF